MYAKYVWKECACVMYVCNVCFGMYVRHVRMYGTESMCVGSVMYVCYA